MAFNDRCTVDGRGVLVKKSIRALGADKDHEEGASKQEYEEYGHENALEKPLSWRILPVFPDDVRRLRSLLDINSELVKPYEKMLKFGVIAAQLLHS